MHVVGARFDHADAARDALAELTDRFDLEPGEAAVRPLGSTDYAAPSDAYLLAGRFEDHEVARVLAIVRARAGVIVELRAENPVAAAVVIGPRAGNHRATARPARAVGPGSPLLRSPRAVRFRAPRRRRVSGDGGRRLPRQ